MTLADFRSLAPVLALSLVAVPAAAADLPAPTGDAVLTVTGAISTTNVGESAVFDMAMLKAMEPVTYETETIWTEGKQTFTGVLLADVMEAVGADSDVLSATAINDYAIQIPSEDWVAGGPIIAFLQNGAPMSVRDKGPLWVIYPYDDQAKYRTEVTYSRSIWQLDRIKVGD